MKTKTLIMLVGLVAIAAVAAGTVIAGNLAVNKQQKNMTTPSTVFLTEDDDGMTVSVHEGDMVNVTLPSFGDGGYTWTITNIDSQMLRLDNQFNWGSSGLMGDFGVDTWVFTALQLGETTICLECARSWAPEDICQTFVVELIVQ